MASPARRAAGSATLGDAPSSPAAKARASSPVPTTTTKKKHRSKTHRTGTAASRPKQVQAGPGNGMQARRIARATKQGRPCLPRKAQAVEADCGGHDDLVSPPNSHHSSNDDNLAGHVFLPLSPSPVHKRGGNAAASPLLAEMWARAALAEAPMPLRSSSPLRGAPGSGSSGTTAANGPATAPMLDLRAMGATAAPIIPADGWIVSESGPLTGALTPSSIGTVEDGLSRSQRLAYDDADQHYKTFMSPRGVALHGERAQAVAKTAAAGATATWAGGQSATATLLCQSHDDGVCAAALDAGSVSSPPPLHESHEFSPPLRSLLKTENGRSQRSSAVSSGRSHTSGRSRVSFSVPITDRLPSPEAADSLAGDASQADQLTNNHLLVQRAMMAIRGAPLAYQRNGWSAPGDPAAALDSRAASRASSLASKISSLHSSEWTETWLTAPMRAGAGVAVGSVAGAHHHMGDMTGPPGRRPNGGRNIRGQAMANGGNGARPRMPLGGPMLRGPPVVGLGVSGGVTRPNPPSHLAERPSPPGRRRPP